MAMRPKTYLRTLTLLHASLCGGLVLFTVLAYAQNRGFNTNTQVGDIYIYVVPIAALTGYFASKFVFQNLIRNLAVEDSLSTKLARYQVALLIQYALLEAPAFLALFAYYQSGTALHLVIVIALIIYLFVQRPRLKKLLREVPLGFDEKKQFDTLPSS